MAIYYSVLQATQQCHTVFLLLFAFAFAFPVAVVAVVAAADFAVTVVAVALTFSHSSRTVHFSNFSRYFCTFVCFLWALLH